MADIGVYALMMLKWFTSRGRIMNTENEDTGIIDENKTYISFFQSVISIGVLTKGRCLQEAADRAVQRIDAGNTTCLHFNQTPFSLAETDEYEPDVAMDVNADDRGIKGDFIISGNVKDMIATKLGKNPTEVTQEDCTQFILHGVHNLLFHEDPPIGKCHECQEASETHFEDEYFCEHSKSPVHRNHKCGSFKRRFPTDTHHENHA